MANYEDLLAYQLEELAVSDEEDDDVDDEDYYVHIDVVQGSSQRVSSRVNIITVLL